MHLEQQCYAFLKSKFYFRLKQFNEKFDIRWMYMKIIVKRFDEAKQLQAHMKFHSYHYKLKFNLRPSDDSFLFFNPFPANRFTTESMQDQKVSKILILIPIERMH